MGRLQERGLEPNDTSANLVVRVSGREAERTQIVVGTVGAATAVARQARRGYWGRRYGYWGYPHFNDVWARRYVEGALIVDVIERNTGALVYRARVTDEVGKNLDKQVAKAMDRGGKNCPVRELTD